MTAEQPDAPAGTVEAVRPAGRGRAGDDRWLLRKDGARLWRNGVTTAPRDEGGRLRGFAKVLRDRTGWKRLEEALRQRAGQLAHEARQKDEFLAVLARELRNPLAPSATPCKSPAWAATTPASWSGCGRWPSARSGTWPGWWATCSTSPASAGA